MKRNFVLLFFITLIMNSLSAQEMQLSFGPEAAFLVYEVNSDIALRDGSNGYFLTENTNSLFFAPGINFSLRTFNDDNNISRGFFFQDRAIFVTNARIKGKSSFNGTTVNINESYSIKDMDFFISIMDFGFGTSSRFKLPNGLQFYTDLGINFTVMDSENDDTEDTLNYLGVGIIANLAFQINLTKTVYLELGLNSIINAFSSQKGTTDLRPIVNKTINYKDSGRFDLTASAVYLNVGWRFDLKKIRDDLSNNNIEDKSPTE